MIHGATRRGLQANRLQVWRWYAVAAAVSLIPGSSPTGVCPSPLPDSAAPCVPCHNRGTRDQVGEWLASPYSEAEGGRGCTDCHGRHCSGNGAFRTIATDRAVVDSRGPRAAARLSVTAVCSGSAVETEVAVSNVGAGHLLPTGPEWRTLFLEVTARDGNQSPLALQAGSRCPPDLRTGVAVPGRVFIRDKPPGGGPALQTRLRPFATDLSRYWFDLPASGRAHVSARLVLARAGGPPLEIASTTTVCSTTEQDR